MVTIKHMTRDGRERVFTAIATERTADGKLVFGTEEVINSGKVYLMNDAGKTVAIYDFDKEQHHGRQGDR